MKFPERRLRRLRRTPALRRLVREEAVTPSDLVAPLFVRDGIDEPVAITSMPGQVQHTIGTLVMEAKRLSSLGVGGVLLFGVPKAADRDPMGSHAADVHGITQRSLSALRETVGDELVIMTDVCLDEFTDHGHCGLLGEDGTVDNDSTLPVYAEIAVSHASAGADVVAPSGMMDGQVAAIRQGLDGSGHEQTAILAYSVKYASALYGPFREAVDVSIAGGGDRRTYQQDPANRREARAEVELDIAEGADMVMVKPATSYLDVLFEVCRIVDVPVAAYQVSGEYAMVKAAAERGWIDGLEVAAEQLLSIKRAGAAFVVTYFAGELAEVVGG